MHSKTDRPLRVGLIVGDDAMTLSHLRSHRAGTLDPSEVRRIAGNSDVGMALQIVDRNMIETSYLIIGRDYLKLKQRDNLNHYDVLFNAISDPDANPECLRVVGRLMKQTNRPWINDPRNVLNTTRDRVAKQLASVDGLYVPKTARITSFTRQDVAKALRDIDFDFPILVRQAGMHGGQTLQLLMGLDDVPENSSEKGVWFVTEFIDFKSPDNIYRKYRAFVIGERVILDHAFPSEDWNVHADSAKTSIDNNRDLLSTGFYEILANDIKYIDSYKDILLELKNILKLDYFGVDFAVFQKSMLLFEANATMN